MNRRQFLGIAGLLFGSALSGTVRGEDILEMLTPPTFVWNPEYSFAWIKKIPYSLVIGEHVFPVEK